jgi:FkbM family methyltransferase
MHFYGQWDPPVDKFLYENYFKNKKNGTFIECGAFDGYTECCCKFFEQYMGWTGINIEPAPNIYQKLCQNRPNSINLQLALSDKNGTAKFKHAIHPNMGNHFGNGSLNHTKEHLNSLKSEGCTFQEFEVKTITYNQLIKQTGIKELTLFVLDVEGNEINVLNGMAGSTVLPEIFCIEHGHIKDKLYKKVESLGYKFDKTSFNNSFFIKN